MNTKELELIRQQLSEPFSEASVRWKPQVVKGDRALATAYVTSRAVMERLDRVLGIDGWQDSYEFLDNGSVLCRLRCRFGDEWIERQDVGSPSEQPDEHDQVKAAVSDALKRAAVKFGVARYLYALPICWVEYDAKTRTLQTPPLPSWAIPKQRGDAAED